jgi:hypothetical protein
MHIGSGGLRRVLAGFVICAAAGCGGSGSPTFSTSLPASASVNTLSSTQDKQLCDETTSFLEMILQSPEFCHVMSVSFAASDAASNTGWTDAQIQSDCNTFAQLCQLLQSGGTTTSTCDPSNCMVTVGQLTTCFNDTGVAFQHYGSTLPSCGSLTRATVANLGPGPEPASCAIVSANCPGIQTAPSTN